ncbi:hypothetical protein BC829DRAFT_383485 [Chytridium lagenaria]|nr:hypothetical protein BC829DRAFT_383485 [Chytridium lagenaria]
MFARIKHRMSIYTITDLDLISPQDIQTRYNNLHSVIFPPSQVGIETVRHEPEDVGTRRFPDGAYVMVAADSKSGKSSLKWEGPFKIVSWSEYGGTYMLQNHEGIVLPRSFMPYDLKFLSSDGIS